MSWLATKLFLEKSWVWIKEHWQIPALLLWSLFVWVIARRNTDAIVEMLEAKKHSYKKQIETLREAHNNELIKREGLHKEYEEALKNVEEEYKKRKKELTESQRLDIKEVVVKSKGDPDEIKKRIEKEFGFKLVE